MIASLLERKSQHKTFCKPDGLLHEVVFQLGHNYPSVCQMRMGDGVGIYGIKRVEVDFEVLSVRSGGREYFAVCRFIVRMANIVRILLGG